MALIKCPECGHEVSTSADACPNCGFKELHTNDEIPNSQPVYNNCDDYTKVLFSTKGLIDPKKQLAIAIVLLIAFGLIIFLLLSSVLPMVVLWIVFFAVCIWIGVINTKAQSEAKSYIDIYCNRVTGRSIPAKTVYGDSNSGSQFFDISIKEIQRVDVSSSGRSVVLYVTNDKYEVQALNCGEKVKQIIESNKNNQN